MKLITKDKMHKFIKYWLPVLIWATIIFSFSSTKAIKASPDYWQDFIAKKLAHVLEYAVFAVLQYRALKSYGVSKRNSAIYAVIFSFVFGATDEIHQSFTPTREPAIRDVIFDTIGAILGVVFVKSLLPKLPLEFKTFAKKINLN